MAPYPPGIPVLAPGEGVTVVDRSDEYAQTCEALLHDADEAMYAAKAQGGRRYVIYEPRVARPDRDA